MNRTAIHTTSAIFCLAGLLSANACDPDDAMDGGTDDGSFDDGSFEGGSFDGGPPDVWMIGDTGTPPGPTVAYPDQCMAGVAPDEACYVSRRDPTSPDVMLASEIAARFMAEHPPERLAWDWSQALLMHALLELSRVDGDAATRAYVERWLDFHIDAGYELLWSDHCPPSLSAMALWQEGRDPDHATVILDVLDYYENVPRTDIGGIAHLGFLGRINPAQWLDSLMMVAVPLARWGELTNDPRWIDEASMQAQIFTDSMQDPIGFYVHAYMWVGATQDPNVYWARGNGWVAVALHELLRIHRNRGTAAPELEAAATSLSDAALAAQDATSGMWWQVVNRPGDTYLETSATALFAYGLARGVRYGYRDRANIDAIQAAMAGVRTRIRRDALDRPIVTGISGPTIVGGFDYYASIALDEDVPFGVGAVILALTEVSGLDALR